MSPNVRKEWDSEDKSRKESLDDADVGENYVNKVPVVDYHKIYNCVVPT